jgi:hypothetical protein
MKIVHRISFHASPGDRARLRSIGLSSLDLREVTPDFVSFEIVESDPRWPLVYEWIDSRSPTDFVQTRFAKAEIAAARWLAVTPDWHFGYPQPEAKFGYLGATYDLTNFCQECGTGLQQKSPFRLLKEPRWGNRSILQLNWVFDEYFVRPEVATDLVETFGLRTERVLRLDEEKLDDITQLVVDEIVPVDVAGLPSTLCPSCGIRKFLPVTQGPFPRLLVAPTRDVVKSQQYFGSGAVAFRQVIASQNLANAIRSKGVRGASFVPLDGG